MCLVNAFPLKCRLAKFNFHRIFCRNLANGNILVENRMFCYTAGMTGRMGSVFKRYDSCTTKKDSQREFSQKTLHLFTGPVEPRQARREHLLNWSLIFDRIKAEGVCTSQGTDYTSTSFGLVEPCASKQRTRRCGRESAYNDMHAFMHRVGRNAHTSMLENVRFSIRC